MTGQSKESLDAFKENRSKLLGTPIDALDKPPTIQLKFTLRTPEGDKVQESEGDCFVGICLAEEPGRFKVNMLGGGAFNMDRTLAMLQALDQMKEKLIKDMISNDPLVALRGMMGSL